MRISSCPVSAGCRKLCRERVASLSQVRPLFFEAVYQPIGRPFGNENPFLHHAPQLPLKCAPVDLRAERLELLDVDAPVFEDVHQGLGLAGREIVLVDEHVASDHPFPPLPDLHQLGGQSGHEVLQPSGHVHVALPDSLDRPVEGGPGPVVVFADGEQALEVIARAVQTQCREQTRRPAVAVQKRMDVYELELGDTAHEDRMGLPFAVQPLHQFRHQDWHFMGWRRRVDRLASGGIDHVVLDLAVFPRRRRPARLPPTACGSRGSTLP